MPSQGSQHLSSSPLCLSLLKFSYATVPNESIAPTPWIHLSSKNSLFAVFETRPVQLEDGLVEKRQKFKVLRDPEVMEELDLNALSAEAHRALAESPDIMSPQLAAVTVVVKVPMIAMKYPLPTGQIRRFQICFATNEEYYEAMKMLSRANVPTTEAGSFPAQQPRKAPQPASKSFVKPSDSASQIGMPIQGSTSYTDGRSNHIGLAQSKFSASSFDLPQTPGVQTSLAPPGFFPLTTATNRARQQMQPSGDGQWPNGELPNIQTVGSRSNISLSTATTLVPGYLQFHAHGMPPRPQNISTTTGPQMNGFTRQDLMSDHSRPSATTAVAGEQMRLELPPRRELPFNKVLKSLPGTGQGDTEIDVTRDKDNGDTQSLISATAKGKRKRSVAQKTTKASAAKKPRATTTRKKVGASPTKEDTPVPSVEELLQQPGDHLSRRNKRAGRTKLPASQETQPPVNTTLSLEIPDSNACSPAQQATGAIIDASPSLGGSGITKRITRATSKSLACIPEQASKGETDVQSVEKRLPCTPADQIVIPLTPGSPTAAIHTLAAEPLRRHQTPLSPSRPDQPHPDGSFTCTDPTQPPTSAQAPAETAMSSSPPKGDVLESGLSCLEADPQFAQGKQKLQAWSDLPAATRVPALRSYFCQLIMDPNFTGLCKTVGSFWEREILQRRIEQQPPLHETRSNGDES